MKKSRFCSQTLRSKAHSTTHNTTQHIATSIAVGHSAVGNGNAECAHVIGDHSVGHVARVGVVFAKATRVGGRAGDTLNFLKDVGEHVGVIVRVDALQNCDKTLETSTGVDVIVLYTHKKTSPRVINN